MSGLEETLAPAVVKMEEGDVAATVTPISLTAPVPMPAAAPVALSAPAGAQVEEKTLDLENARGAMDFSAMKDSMDAALASIMDSSRGTELTPEVVTAAAEASAPPLNGDDKQAQLRAMYLAGFQAAAEAQNKESLKQNFENAVQQDNSNLSSLAPAASQPSTLTIPVPNGDPVLITQHEPSEVIKVVGVMQALDGNMAAQLETLQKKADQWGEQIHDGWDPTESCMESTRYDDLALTTIPTPRLQPH
jgi:hypothetical protein